MNRISSLFGIQYPIIQGGMVWCSGWKLASAVSNAGGLGLIGSGSMYPDVLREHIRKCRAATDKPFGGKYSVDVPTDRGNHEHRGGGRRQNRIYLRRKSENVDRMVERARHHSGTCRFFLQICHEM